MGKLKIVGAILFILAGSTYAGTLSWVGGGTAEPTNGTPIPKAVILLVKIRTSDNAVRFKIKDRADLNFNFDGASASGKNLLSTLLTAKATGSEVVFKADCTLTPWGTECGVDEFILGNTIF